MASIQFEKVLSIEPNSEKAFINLGKVYFDDGRLLKAIEVARQGLLSRPNNIPTAKEPHKFINSFKSVDEALVACNKILSINKDDAEAINVMGTIYEKKGLYNKAKK